MMPALCFRGPISFYLISWMSSRDLFSRLTPLSCTHRSQPKHNQKRKSKRRQRRKRSRSCRTTAKMKKVWRCYGADRHPIAISEALAHIFEPDSLRSGAPLHDRAENWSIFHPLRILPSQPMTRPGHPQRQSADTRRAEAPKSAQLPRPVAPRVPHQSHRRLPPAGAQVHGSMHSFARALMRLAGLMDEASGQGARRINSEKCSPVLS